MTIDARNKQAGDTVGQNTRTTMTDKAVIINAKSHLFVCRGVFHIDSFQRGVTIPHRRKKQT